MKKHYAYLLTAIISLLLILNGCELNKDNSNPSNPDNTLGSVTITGQVVEASTGDPVNNAIVKVTDGINEEGGLTNAQGRFSLILGIDKNKEVSVAISKQGYSSDTTTVFASIDAVVEANVVQLKQESGSGTNPSGGAASIFLYEQSSESVGVKESGAIETAQIIFEIQDSSGVHIDLDNKVTVNFLFGNTPGGGEYLHPSSVISNALGRASVTLNTGTKAGVVQVIAEAATSNGTIRSKPVLIAIHGGLPDDGHFGVASAKVNYPALGIIGYDIDFTAYVGDKYSNPVRPGTAVYFETTSGIIGGSDLTSILGTSTVKLLTQPYPNHPTYGKGFFVVTARTADENLAPIETETVRLQSGFPLITVNPTVVNVANAGSQDFTYTVKDINDNPIAQGNGITVVVEQGDVKVSGNTRIDMPDTQSPAFTSFAFTVYDSKPDSVKLQTVVINISSAGPNGNNNLTITGTSR